MNKLSPIIKGTVTGLLMVILTLVFFYSNQPEDSPLQYMIYPLYAGGVMWTLISYSQSAAFSGKFGDLFGQGFRCFIMVTLIMVVFAGVFSLLHPEFAENSAKYYRESLLKDHNKTTAEIDELVKGVKKQYTTGIVSFTIFRYLIIGVIFTVAGSGILMKRK
jgi:hypothetical protein